MPEQSDLNLNSNYIGSRIAKLRVRLKEEGLDKKFMTCLRRGHYEQAQKLAEQMIDKYGQSLDKKEGDTNGEDTIKNV